MTVHAMVDQMVLITPAPVIEMKPHLGVVECLNDYIVIMVAYLVEYYAPLAFLVPA